MFWKKIKWDEWVLQDIHGKMAGWVYRLGKKWSSPDKVYSWEFLSGDDPQFGYTKKLREAKNIVRELWRKEYNKQFYKKAS